MYKSKKKKTRHNRYIDKTLILYADVIRLTLAMQQAIHYPPEPLHSSRVRIRAWVRRLRGVASQIKLEGFNHIAPYYCERVLFTNCFTTRRL